MSLISGGCRNLPCSSLLLFSVQIAVQRFSRRLKRGLHEAVGPSRQAARARPAPSTLSPYLALKPLVLASASEPQDRWAVERLLNVPRGTPPFIEMQEMSALVAACNRPRAILASTAENDPSAVDDPIPNIVIFQAPFFWLATIWAGRQAAPYARAATTRGRPPRSRHRQAFPSMASPASRKRESTLSACSAPTSNRMAPPGRNARRTPPAIRR
jgi:hypothetical protein